MEQATALSGKCNRILIPGISVGGAVIIYQADIANTTASSLLMACNSDNHDPRVRVVKYSAETLLFNFTPRVIIVYNITFSMDKLLAALERCHNARHAISDSSNM
jgi:hypothetical protein